MREMAKMNAMRSVVVVVGALAFGYLTLHLGFKPYLEKAQQQQQHTTVLDKSDDISNPQTVHEGFFSDRDDS